MPAKILPTPSAKYLHTLFNYDPDTGTLTWKERILGGRGTNVSFNTRYAGQSVGALNSCGHRQVRVEGRLTTVHRIAWKMMTGKDPTNQIDHINGNPDDNRWNNLREATQLHNTWNQKMRSTNTTGHTNIYRLNVKRASSKKFIVIMSVESRPTTIGAFVTLEEAMAAREAALAKYRDPTFRRHTT